MAVVYDRCAYNGPDVGGRYFTVPFPNTPTGDFCMFFAVKMPHLWIGKNPSVVQPGWVSLAPNTVSTGSGVTAGGASYLMVYPRNSSATAKQGMMEVRLNSSGTAGVTGSILLGTSVFNLNDVVLVVIQSNAGTIQVKTCKPGGTTVTEASAARNASYTTATLGSWQLGYATTLGSWEGVSAFQFAGMASVALADTDIQNLANGTDPETVIAAGNRMALWLLDPSSASIASSWGTAGAATRTGTWTNQAAQPSPIIPNAATRLAVTNEPVPWGSINVNNDGTGPTFTVKGTYSGYTPTALQVRVESASGADVVAWTDLTSFTASAGAWSGVTPAIPPGGLYRLQVRDKTTQTIVWRGANPFTVGVTTCSMGQSQFTRIEVSPDPTGTFVAGSITGQHYVVLPRIAEVYIATVDNTGAGMLQAMNAYYAATGGKSLTHIIAAVVGTSSGDWAGRGSTTWTPMLAAIDAIKPTNVLFEWLNGVSENGFGPSTIKTNLSTIFTNLGTDIGSTRGIGFRFKMLPHNRDSGNIQNAMIRQAQYEWARDHPQAGTGVLLGPWWGDLLTEVDTAGTAQAGTATSITLAAGNTIPWSGDTNVFVAIVSGTGAGQTQKITAFNTTTKVATVASWTTIPDATSGYVTYSTDSTHSDGRPVGAQRFGPRYGQDIAYSFGYSTLTGRGPTPISATHPASGTGSDGSIIDVTFSHRGGANLRTPNGGTTATGVAAFDVSEDGFTTLKTIASAVITGPTTIRLTLSAAPSNPANLKVRYAATPGPSPVTSANWNNVGGGVGDLLYDDSGISPMGGALAEFTDSLNLTVTGGVLLSAGFFS